jgi:hypothetical protein
MFVKYVDLILKFYIVMIAYLTKMFMFNDEGGPNWIAVVYGVH